MEVQGFLSATSNTINFKAACKNAANYFHNRTLCTHYVLFSELNMLEEKNDVDDIGTIRYTFHSKRSHTIQQYLHYPDDTLGMNLYTYSTTLVYIETYVQQMKKKIF